MALKSKGSRNRLAARDYIEKPTIAHMDVHVYEKRKAANNPNLRPCSACGYEGLHVDAETCPNCQAPLGAYRRHWAAVKQQKERYQFSAMLLFGVALVMIAGQWLMPNAHVLGGLMLYVSRATAGVVMLAALVFWARSMRM